MASINASLNPLSSFRAQMVLFIAAMLVLTTVALNLINQRLERRINRQVEEHIEQLTLAIDLALRSRQSKQFLFDFVPQESQGRLSVSRNNIVSHILVTDSRGNILDSTSPDEIGQSLPAAINELPTVRQGDLLRDQGASNTQGRTITFTVESVNDQGVSDQRRIIIVFSMNRLTQTRREADRDRLLATLALGLLMILLVAGFSRRFTRPITELAKAAQKVAAGDLEFQVLVLRRDEVGKLAETFNEMLFGLRNKRELEEQLQRAERSAVVGRLASGIAHEIRNPLNFINLSIDHLKEKFAPSEQTPHNLESSRAEYTHILVTIKDEIARLNTLVSNFLSYGRPSRLKLRELDARRLIEEVISLVQAQAEQQGVKLAVQEGPESCGDHHLRADAEQIKTCFSNLIINAVQAMPDGGRLTVTLKARESDLEIIFADTGCGIAPEALEQIFEPYYSTKETGIGLGLPLTRKLIEDHGGSITVTSEIGVGTTFIITLPREPVTLSTDDRAPAHLAAH
jgi:signal transduction histidine kinase